MYKYTAILLAVATLITAQSLPTVPSCSVSSLLLSRIHPATWLTLNNSSNASPRP